MSESLHTKFEALYEKIHNVTNIKLLLAEDGCYDDPNVQKAWCLYQMATEQNKAAINLAIKNASDHVYYSMSCPVSGTKDPSELRQSILKLGQEDVLSELDALQLKSEKYDAIHTPEIDDFLSAVKNEALFQRESWHASHDAGKTDADWFWLIGYLAGKALHKPEKLLHHIITTAAVCLNWHSAKVGQYTDMRPGIDSSKAGLEALN